MITNLYRKVRQVFKLRSQYYDFTVNRLRWWATSSRARPGVSQVLPIAWTKPLHQPTACNYDCVGIDFVEAGERKLHTCVDEIIRIWRQRAEFPHRGGEGSWATGACKERRI